MTIDKHMRERYEDFIHTDEYQPTEWIYNEKHNELNAIRGGSIVGIIALNDIKTGNDLWDKIRHYKDKNWWEPLSFIKALKASGIVKQRKTPSR